MNPSGSAQRRAPAQARGHTLLARQVHHAGGEQPSRCCPGPLCWQPPIRSSGMRAASPLQARSLFLFVTGATPGGTMGRLSTTQYTHLPTSRCWTQNCILLPEMCPWRCQGEVLRQVVRSVGRLRVRCCVGGCGCWRQWSPSVLTRLTGMLGCLLTLGSSKIAVRVPTAAQLLVPGAVCRRVPPCVPCPLGVPSSPRPLWHPGPRSPD